MTGFLARVVARAAGRESSLAPRPDSRFVAIPFIAHDSPPPRAHIPPTRQDAAKILDPARPNPEFLLAPRSPGPTPGRPAAPSASVSPLAQDLPRDATEPPPFEDPLVPHDATAPRRIGDDGPNLMPLVHWDTPLPAGEPLPVDDIGAPRNVPTVPRGERRSVLIRNERPSRDGTVTEPEPPAIVVHIGRIDIRAAQTSVAAPTGPPRSRLQRPTLEAYLQSRERGRS